MTIGPQFCTVCDRGDNTRLDVLFVHGLTGDPSRTWTVGSSKEFWPNWLCTDQDRLSVYALGYPTNIIAKLAKGEMTLHERASNMLELLASKGIGKRPIVMICHSLGGILVKEMLRTSSESSDDGWRAIANKTRLVVFIATPHKGASLARVATTLLPRLASKSVELLSNDSGYLTSLNQSYRDIASRCDIATVSYYETHETKAGGLVVEEDSADPGVSGMRPIAVDADHVNICKPINRSSFVYCSVCRHIENVLTKTSSSLILSDLLGAFMPADYAASAEFDRRDLQQKLIAAGREYEYRRANDLQNKFAQRYHRLGLHSEAKAQSDALLSEVEQRFITHVYNAKICNGAHPDEVAVALQEKVIDPICEGSRRAQLSPLAVLQALYFLTEQCFIQWDVT